MIYILPIEPLQERYSSWWYSYLPKKILSVGYTSETIDGVPLIDKVETGTVLDAAGTNFYKSTQLQKICKMFKEGKVKTGDHFLVCDIWFPGIEMLRYMETLYNVKIYIWGVWHAGSSTNYDFAQPMHSWSKYFEIGFLNMCNGIFVGSEYSKESIVTRLMYFLDNFEIENIYKKIYSTGMPLDYNSLQQYEVQEKKNQIVFPHRPDFEKGPTKFMDLIEVLSLMWEDFESYKFIFCTSKEQYKSSSALINARLAYLKTRFDNIEVRENLAKEDYYKLLGESKLMISTTLEENFGYILAESIALGCNVLVPHNFSHVEILEEDHSFMYKNDDELIKKTISLATKENQAKELKEYIQPYRYTVDEWVKIMSKG